MANIKITAQNEIYDGMPITFRAPCDSAEIDGLKVCFAHMTQTFTLRDAHGNALVHAENLFSTGVYVKAILDTSAGYAYIQNADTNKYIEKRLEAIEETINDEEYIAGIPAGGATGQILVKKSDTDYDAEWQNAPEVSTDIIIDDTLSVSGAAADAATVGEEIATLANELDAVRDELSNIEPSDPMDPAMMPYSYGTTDLIAGVSELTTGHLYFVYE